MTKTARLDEAAKAPIDRTYDVFLSHRLADARDVDVVKARLESDGLVVYVDWLDDADLDRAAASSQTAERLRQRIERSRSVLVLTTTNAVRSRWIPWEVGYADGAGKRVGILPAVTDMSVLAAFKGVEFFALYPFVDEGNDGSGVARLWATSQADSSYYVEFESWLRGNALHQH